MKGQGQDLKTRKAFIMKKSSLRTLVSYLNGTTVDNLDEIKAELEAELAKDEAKAHANRELYATAHDVAMAYLTDTPMTIADWYTACADELPDNFSKSKLQYAVREYWASEVVKVDGKVNQYRKA